MPDAEKPEKPEMSQAETRERERLGRILAETGHYADIMTFESLDQLEALVRSRAAWLHGWYEGTLRGLAKPKE